MVTLGAALTLASVSAPAAQAQPLDFELGLTSPYDYPAIGSYGGYDFTGFWGLNIAAFNAVYPSGAAANSGTGIGFGRGLASISSSNAFFLTSLYLGSSWIPDYPVTITGSRNGADLWTYTLNGGTSGPQQFAPLGNHATTAIDNLRFETSGYEFYIDDLSLSTATVTPEPISMALLGTGLAGLGGVRLARRRRNRS
jgi:hypothetical protein